MKYSGIGGQAVIEGIMMKNKDQYATAVRRPDGGIEVKKDTYVSMTEKEPFCGLPFVRGVFSFADSMILGMRTLSYSASFFEDDEDSEPGKLELWMDKVFGEKVEQVLMAVVMVFSVIMAIGTSPNPLLRTTTPGLESNRRGGLIVEEETGLTTKEMVYAGGDVVTGSATVIMAMGAGKKAAAAIHKALSEKKA